MNLPYADRTAKWLVGGQLACVLHLGDNPLAFQLADQGHEVVVVAEQLSGVRHSDISYVQAAYVRAEGPRLPFTSDSFDVIVAPDIRRPTSALADFARVLRTGGLLSTVAQTYDDSIPWLRKMREIIGERPDTTERVDTLSASGLFGEPERNEFGSWEQLDLDGLMKFARATMAPDTTEIDLSRVRELFVDYGARSGSLRLRHQTHCLRARVDKEGLPAEPEPPDTMLLDFR